MGRFWPMIHREHLFCPGVELPQDGWYAALPFQGRSVRPISSTAWMDTPGGQLRILHANCYPHLGSTRVRVEARGETLAVLSTSGADTVHLSVPPGRLVFVAERIFRAEDTGALTEYGGWISVKPEDSTAPGKQLDGK
jgi:hypothetical protein